MFNIFDKDDLFNNKPKINKDVPVYPVNTSYASRDCTSHGNCPVCNTHVEMGPGRYDKECPNCGQKFSWH